MFKFFPVHVLNLMFSIHFKVDKYCCPYFIVWEIEVKELAQLPKTLEGIISIIYLDFMSLIIAYFCIYPIVSWCEYWRKCNVRECADTR